MVDLLDGTSLRAGDARTVPVRHRRKTFIFYKNAFLTFFLFLQRFSE